MFETQLSAIFREIPQNGQHLRPNMSEHYITNKSFVQQVVVKFYIYSDYILYLIETHVNVIRSIIIIIIIMLVSQNPSEIYDYSI